MRTVAEHILPGVTIEFTSEEVAGMFRASKGHHDSRMRKLTEFGGVVAGLFRELTEDEGAPVTFFARRTELEPLIELTNVAKDGDPVLRALHKALYDLSWALQDRFLRLNGYRS